MPKLVIENGPDKGMSYVITADGRPFFAGRDSAAQVPLRDEMASRRHFQIEAHKGVYHIRDLTSSNGTFLNGRIIKGLLPLASNDRIQVGTSMITFIDESQPTIIGSEIAGYQVMDRVGRGGMGTVYRSLQKSLDRIVALKILASHLTKNTNFVNLFIREARAAGALSHPNIVQVYDVGVKDETYFFSMEYIPHGSVEDILNKDGKIPLDKTLCIIRDAAQGLEYAELKGIIHRDIKPGNLMVGLEGVIKIGDLGIARSTEGEGMTSQKDGVSGSPHYIAPEQARGHDIDHRVDIYSLGISFYQMLCGKTPFSGKTPREVILKHLNEEPEPVSERIPGLPEEVVKLVHRMMAKNPSERPESATALLRELEPLLLKYADEDAALAGASTRPGWKRWGILFGILLILGGVAFGSVYAWQQGKEEQKQAQRKLTAWREQADRVRNALTQEDLEQAREALEDLTALGDPPSEEAGTLEDLTASIETAEQERERKKKEQEASTRLAAIPACNPDENSLTYIEELEKYVTELETFIAAEANAGTPALEKAGGLLESARARIKARKRREEDTTEVIERLTRNIEGDCQFEQYFKALERLKQVPDDHRYARFVGQLEQLRTDLDGRVRTAWSRLVREKITPMVSDQQYSEAIDEIDAFLNRRLTGFPEPILAPIRKKRAEIEALRSGGGTDEAGTPRQEARAKLAEALSTEWERWSINLWSPTYYADLNTIRESAREISPDTHALVKRHAEFLGGWGKVRRSLISQDVRQRDLEITVEGQERLVEFEKIKDDRVYVSFDGSRAVLEWSELSAKDRVNVLGILAVEPRHKLYAGLLSEFLGLGASRWPDTQEHTHLSRDVEDLKRMLELSRDE